MWRWNSTKNLNLTINIFLILVLGVTYVILLDGFENENKILYQVISLYLN